MTEDPAVERDKVRDKLQFIRDNVAHLERIRGAGRDAFLDDRIAQAAATHLLQVAVEAMIDIANHVSARLRLGVPKTYRDAVDQLVEAGILPRAHQETFRRMVRFRNRAVHLYDRIDPEEVYEILENRLADFDRFAAAIVRRFFKDPA